MHCLKFEGFAQSLTFFDALPELTDRNMRQCAQKCNRMMNSANIELH